MFDEGVIVLDIVQPAHLNRLATVENNLKADGIAYSVVRIDDSWPFSLNQFTKMMSMLETVTKDKMVQLLPMPEQIKTLYNNPRLTVTPIVVELRNGAVTKAATGALETGTFISRDRRKLELERALNALMMQDMQGQSVHFG